MAAVKVLAVADAVSPLLYDHFRPERWRDIDLVLSAGDLPPDLLDFLTTSLRVPVLYVHGNHDAVYEEVRFDGSENIHGKLVECNGLRIAGFEGCRRYNQGPYQYSEREMARIVRRVGRRAAVAGGPDIVLTHAPPAGCHDSDDVCHQGFACFRQAIDRWKPAYFVHGHMHNYTGGPAVTTLGETTVVNAYHYQVFDVEVPEREPAPSPKWERARALFRSPKPAVTVGRGPLSGIDKSRVAGVKP